MAELSPAEIMLNNSAKIEPLIKRLRAVLMVPVPYVGIDLSQPTKAKIAAFQADLQRYIDELSAQREEVVGLVKLIPDTTARTVIELRYGLTGSGCQKVPWLDMEELMNYSRHSIFRYHRKGVDQLNQILEGQ